MSSTPTLGPFSWERMFRAVEKVRERLKRATSALNDAKVPYAVIGGNAVAAWVSQVDESAVRNTPHIDLLIQHEDFDAMKVTLEAAGFVLRKNGPRIEFLDGPDAIPRDRVRVRVEPNGIDDVESIDGMTVIPLESLVEMELKANRAENGMHLRDLIDVELVDDTWPQKYQPELPKRLQALLDDPDG